MAALPDRSDTQQIKYNDPAGGVESSVGPQMNTYKWKKAALIEAAKEAVFSQLADVESMPKQIGMKIKRYHWIPLLDDANINDQGIDAAGVSTTVSVTILINHPDLDGENLYETDYCVGEGESAGAALSAAKVIAYDIFINKYKFDSASYADYAAVKPAAVTANGYVVDDTGAAVPASGNLYGSSKDVGTISSKMPALSETGGRVNRVGFRRMELEGSFTKFGFFDEYTQESLDFDTEADLWMNINREMLRGAHEMTEDAIQIDLLNGAGVVRLGGEATSVSEITGEAGEESLITYNDLMRLSITLDDNRCPKKTKIITGTRMVDTRVAPASRPMFIGSELIPMVRRMKDMFDAPAFIPIEKYAAGAPLMNGEIGMIDQFKIIVAQEMMNWSGKGATVVDGGGAYRNDGSKYNVYPMLVVGSGSFTTIGFQTSGSSTKFTIYNKRPGESMATRDDPFGETGFMSIKWYYGMMLLRPERIACCKTVAEW